MLRTSTGNLKFIEATLSGVDLIDWNDFVDYKCYRHFERIVYRRLASFQNPKTPKPQNPFSFEERVISTIIYYASSEDDFVIRKSPTI